MQIATYDQWLDLKILDLKRQVADGGPVPTWKCAECAGQGCVIDFGERTGEEFEAQCPECDGDGTVEFEPDSVDRKTAQKVLDVQVYTDEVLKDLRDLAKHTGRHELMVLAEHEFVVYSDIKSKTLMVEIQKPGQLYRRSMPVLH